MPEKRFKTTLVKSDGKLGFTLPFDPNEAWGEKERHHLAGSVGGHKFRGALESVDGEYRFTLGPAWVRDNEVEEGAEIEVVLDAEGPHSGNVSPDVASALSAKPETKAFFDALPTFYRKNYIRWIEEAKRPETRASRIDEMMRLLKAGRRER